LSAAADVAVVERYRDMIGSLQQDVQLAQAKNVNLLRQMHQVRLDHEQSQAALADVHSMETRIAFNTLRQIEDRNVHAFSALKQSQKATDLSLASLGREHEDDNVFLSEMEALLKNIEVLKQRAEEAERRDLETSDELQGALLEIERLREVEADSMTRLSEGCDSIFRMEDELRGVERARQCAAEQAEELIEALQKMQNQNTELENKYESSLEANAYLAEQNNALKHAVLGLEGKLSELNAEIQLLRQRAHKFESRREKQRMLTRIERS
jgi:chromosome segregation ATPase